MKKNLIVCIIMSMTLVIFSQSSMHQLGVQIKRELSKTPIKPTLFQKVSSSRSHIKYDTLITAPTINFRGTQILETLSLKISNTTEAPIEFSLPDIPQTDSQYLADYILGSITNPYDSIRSALEVDSINTVFLKNYLHYKNDQLIFSNSWDDSILFSREHSLIGRIYSTGSTQCGNSNIHGNLLGIKSGYFSRNDFRLISVPGHSTNEIIIGKDTIYADRDVGTVGYMFRDPNNVNKRYSYMELREDTLRINEKYLQNGKDPHQGNTLSEYRKLLMGPCTFGSMPWVTTAKIDGKFILPANSSLEITLPISMLFLDVSDTPTLVSLGNASSVIDIADSMELEGYACDWCMDSVRNIARRLIVCNPEIVDSLMLGHSVTLNTYNSINDAGKSFSEMFIFDCPREIIPSMVLTIDQHNDTLIVGKDVKAPLLVLSAQDPMMLDSIRLTLPFTPKLWSSSNVAPVVSNKEVHYLDNGWIAPGSQSIKLSYNWNILSLYKTWFFSGAQGLTIERKEEWCTVPTGIDPMHSSMVSHKGKLILVEYYNYLGQQVDPDTYHGFLIQVYSYEQGYKVVKTYKD
ncbi:MAG TPA: hypothetical protein PL084_06630 [Chitinophagales bacterium]|nr:hypothetical protein [Chitinophagales bacterium]HRP39388.1 hypothetical protein [Chitinophagales bacterium]